MVEGELDEKSSNIPKLNKDNSFKRKFSAYISGYGDSKLIARKSPRGKSKNFSFAFIEELNDIQENCSPKTIKEIKNLFDQNNQLKG